ncbi:unnamed protein product [Arabidopsis lyrata]|nr:unnamed protein product [Arabidopsis lyrata]
MAEPKTRKKTSTTSIKPDLSQLPEELLHLISTHLKNCFDVVHARSVCSLWRSTFPFPSSLLRQSYSLPKFHSQLKDLCTLEKVPLFLLRVPIPAAAGSNSEYFLGRISRDESEDHVELPSPLQCAVKIKIQGSYPTLMNMLDCQVLALGHQYRIPGWNCNRVAFLLLDKKEKRGEFIVLINCISDLMVLASVEMRWKQLKYIPHDLCKDVLTFRGRFYATFISGKIVAIDPYSLEVTLLLPSPKVPVPYLVPSGNDELFLVEPIVVNSRSTYRVSRLDEKAGNLIAFTKKAGNVISDI